jgi:hypothetical protein
VKVGDNRNGERVTHAIEHEDDEDGTFIVEKGGKQFLVQLNEGGHNETRIDLEVIERWMCEHMLGFPRASEALQKATGDVALREHRASDARTQWYACACGASTNDPTYDTPLLCARERPGPLVAHAWVPRPTEAKRFSVDDYAKQVATDALRSVQCPETAVVKATAPEYPRHASPVASVNLASEPTCFVCGHLHNQ